MRRYVVSKLDQEGLTWREKRSANEVDPPTHGHGWYHGGHLMVSVHRLPSYSPSFTIWSDRTDLRLCLAEETANSRKTQLQFYECVDSQVANLGSLGRHHPTGLPLNSPLAAWGQSQCAPESKKNLAWGAPLQCCHRQLSPESNDEHPALYRKPNSSHFKLS